MEDSAIKKNKTIKVARTVSVSDKPAFGASPPTDHSSEINVENYETVIKSLKESAGDEKYKIVRTFAKGGMKTIFGARDRISSRTVAMAVFQDAPSRKADALRFIQEAMISAELEHPNIIPVHDIGVNGFEEPFFTMKLAGGEDLACVIDKLAADAPGYRKKYGLSFRLEIFGKICDAVAFAHSKGVLHLDIKPENIQVGDFGEVLVLDWGLAKRKSDIAGNGDQNADAAPADQLLVITERTMDGLAKGTPGFMAPEQAAGKNTQRDERTDIYALGGLLYSLVTFRKPVEGDDVNDVLLRTIRGEITPPRKLSPEFRIPRPVEAIAMKAMAKEPIDRYSSVKELKEELDAFTRGYATKAERAGVLTRGFLMLRRNWALASIVFLLTASLAAILLLWGLHELKLRSGWGLGRDIAPTDAQSLSSDWIVESGEWIVEGGGLKAALAGKDKSMAIYYRKPFAGSVALEFDAMVEDEKSLEPGGDLSAILLANLSTGERYDLQVGAKNNTLNSIQKLNIVMVSEPFQLEPSKNYRIRVEKDDETLRLYLDGKLRLSFQDIFNLKSGRIGFYTYGAGKIFKNIKVYQKRRPELTSPLNEGDAFYNRSRNLEGSEKILYLKDAYESYLGVYESNGSRETGRKALVKMAYVLAELGRFEEAADAFKRAKLSEYSLQDLIFEGDLWFKAGKYRIALDAYQRACERFPERRSALGQLVSERVRTIPPNAMSQELRDAYLKIGEQSDK